MSLKKKVLVTGGTGLLGKALVETASENLEIIATYIGDYTPHDLPNVRYKRVDILDSKKHKEMFSAFRPDVVIHAASIGSPDFAEKNKEITWKVNVEGTSNIISLCREFGASFVYISSNGIFDGDNAPYDENSIPQPINYYGMTKLEGEIITRKSGLVHSIVRPILMYGWNHEFERDNIVTLGLSKLRKGENVFAYDDVFVNPLFSGSCARAIWQIINLDRYGVYNIAGADRGSIYDLIKMAAEIFGCDAGLVRPVKQGYFNELVKRPVDTSFNTKKMSAELKCRPLGLREGFLEMKEYEKKA